MNNTPRPVWKQYEAAIENGFSKDDRTSALRAAYRRLSQDDKSRLVNLHKAHLESQAKKGNVVQDTDILSFLYALTALMGMGIIDELLKEAQN